jgi:predicted dehydrogenase
MLGTAARADVVLMMASKFRYVADLVQAQRMVRDNLIGEIVWLEVALCQPADMVGRWNADPKVAGGGVLIDVGTHAVDVVRGFLGPVARVFAHLGRRVQRVAVEDSVTVQFESGAGTLAVARLSWSLDAGTDWFVTVHGARGTLQVGWTASRYRLRGQEAWTEFGSGYDMTGAMARQLQDFAWLVTRPGHEPVVRAEDAIDSVRVIEAAYRAARVERWIPVQGYSGEFA